MARAWMLALALLAACAREAPERRPQDEARQTAQPDAAQGLADGAEFDDCRGGRCPRMVILPAGDFVMGSPQNEAWHRADEAPQHAVHVPRFAIGKYEVTFEEWAACAVSGGCRSNPEPGDQGWGRGRRPVFSVSWNDAQDYVRWLSERTGRNYRLASEAEWEYAARAGAATAFPVGATITPGDAQYDWTSRYGNGPTADAPAMQTAEAGSFPGSSFGLHDMIGNVAEWVEDCAHGSYEGAPADGSAWVSDGCAERVQRGGSWFHRVQFVRAAQRNAFSPNERSVTAGFRVARDL